MPAATHTAGISPREFSEVFHRVLYFLPRQQCFVSGPGIWITHITIISMQTSFNIAQVKTLKICLQRVDHTCSMMIQIYFCRYFGCWASNYCLKCIFMMSSCHDVTSWRHWIYYVTSRKLLPTSLPANVLESWFHFCFCNFVGGWTQHGYSHRICIME